MSFFSLIIPVYNTEKYLRECLDSVKTQTFEDYEAILVDDGSTDGSPLICDEYARNDPRFRVFHKDNSGLFDTRLLGITKATGTYYIGLDSDDYISADCLEKIHDAVTKSEADVISWGIRMFGDEIGSNIPSIADGSVHAIDEYLYKITENADHSMCNKAIPIRCFDLNDYNDLPSGINLGEDHAMLIPALLKTESAYAIKDELYFYRKVKGTISYTMSLKKVLDLTLVSDFVQKYHEKKGCATDQLDKTAYHRYLDAISWRIWGTFIDGNFDPDTADQIHDNEFYRKSAGYENKKDFIRFRYTVLRLFRRKRYRLLKLCASARKLIPAKH